MFQFKFDYHKSIEKVDKYLAEGKVDRAISLLEKMYGQCLVIHKDEVCARLGDLYGENGKKPDYDKAIYWYSKITDMFSNYYIVQYILGRLYTNKAEYEKAIACYEIAAAGGHDGAWNNLGCMYEDGEGVPVDKEKAVECYKKALDLNSQIAYDNLLRIYKKSKDTILQAVHLMRNKGKDEDEIRCLFENLSVEELKTLREQCRETQPNGPDDLLCMRELIERGEKVYKRTLGLAYKKLENERNAVYWLTRSAKEDNDSWAWYGLSFYGTKEEQLDCLRKSLATKHTKATGYRNSLMRLGRLLTEDGEYEQAEALYQEALQRGRNKALARLGDIYGNREYAGFDLDKAVNYYADSVKFYKTEEPEYADKVIRKKWVPLAVRCHENRDYGNAVRILEPLEEAGIPEASAALVDIYLDKAYENHSEKKAVFYAEKACKAKQALQIESAILALYYYFYNKKDYKNAYSWAGKLDSESKQRKFLLAMHCLYGLGVSKDYVRGIQLLDKAVYQDKKEEAIPFLMEQYLHCPERALRNFSAAGRLIQDYHLPDGERWIGEIKRMILYEDYHFDYVFYADSFLDNKSFPKDRIMALSCLYKALDLPLETIYAYQPPRYAKEVEKIYQEGRILEWMGTDYHKTLDLYKKAAEQGHVEAMHRIGQIWGAVVVTSDFKWEYVDQWRKKAKNAGCPYENLDKVRLAALALHNDAEAMKLLTNIVKNEKGEDDKIVSLLRRAEYQLNYELATQGDPTAMIWLCEYFDKKKNEKTLIYWMERAIATGNGEALYYAADYGHDNACFSRSTIKNLASRASIAGCNGAARLSNIIRQEEEQEREMRKFYQEIRTIQINQEMRSYGAQLNLEERFSNLFWSGGSFTNLEMYALGEMDYHSYVYEAEKRQKKLNERRRELELGLE